MQGVFYGSLLGHRKLTPDFYFPDFFLVLACFSTSFSDFFPTFSYTACFVVKPLTVSKWREKKSRKIGK